MSPTKTHEKMIEAPSDDQVIEGTLKFLADMADRVRAGRVRHFAIAYNTDDGKGDVLTCADQASGMKLAAMVVANAIDCECPQPCGCPVTVLREMTLHNISTVLGLDVTASALRAEAAPEAWGNRPMSAMTEDEASKRWCHAAVASHTDPRRGFRASDEPGDPMEFPCIASRCMAWRWEPSEWAGKLPHAPDPEKGYCGLAGEP